VEVVELRRNWVKIQAWQSPIEIGSLGRKRRSAIDRQRIRDSYHLGNSAVELVVHQDESVRVGRFVVRPRLRYW
jgi:hypothetical protein